MSGGVNVLRVGVQTLEMLDRWIHAKGRMFYPFADQSALNKLGLCNLSLTLPERFVSLGNLTRIGFGSKTIMFHAVGTTGSSKRAMLRAAVLRSTLLLPAFAHSSPHTDSPQFSQFSRLPPRAPVHKSFHTMPLPGNRNQSVNPAGSC